MKKQLKKSLSLFLAVLMLMTSWVWIAPEKAEAGAPTNYTVEMDFSVSDACNGGEVRADVTHISNNGTGSETKTSWALDKCESDEGDYTLSKDFSGWPAKIYLLVDQGGVRTQNIQLKKISINGKTVLEGTWTLNPGHWGSADRTFEPNSYGNAAADGQSGTVSGTAEGTWNWARPKLDTATATLDTAAHTLAKLGGADSKSTITLGGYVDDYGVNWTGTLNRTFNLRVDEGVSLGANASISTSGNTGTVTIKPDFQTLYPDKPNAKLYIDWTATGGKGTKSGTETITVDFPTYKATFHANGGKIGADDSENLDEVVLEGEKAYYGAVIGTSPAYRAREGYKFLGFYSVDNDDALGLTTSLKGKEFKDGETKITHTDYGVLASQFKGDTDWYAAWQATPLNINFVTADNQLIATLEGRYNNYMTADNMYKDTASLMSAIRAAHTSGKVKFNDNDEPIYTDGSTSYNFDGWRIVKAYDESVLDKEEDTVLYGDVTFQAVYTKASSKTYTVTFKNNYGNVLSTKSDYKYRDSVIIPDTEPTKNPDDVYTYEFIGWAKDIGTNFYAVDENNMDENGAVIAYTHKDGAEFFVKGDASYVPVFRMIPIEYSVTYNYTVDGGTTDSVVVGGFNWDNNPTMPEIKDNYTAGGYRYSIVGWTVGEDTEVKQLDQILVKGNTTLTAVYGEGVPAEYTINFYGKDTDGETDVLLNGDNNLYKHNSAVAAPEVPLKIETDASLYTFAGWSPEVETTADGDADYYATYTRQDYADLHFYNYDGTLIYELDGKENGFFAGETTIPAYENLVDGKNVLPEKAEDVVGKYIFSGWKDSSGNTVEPGTDKFTGDTYLYAQFDTDYAEYTVEFFNEDQVVSRAKYHYGEEIVIPADPTKAADVAYIYDFKAWSPDVSEVCHGDATYTATYRRTPQYYKVTWFDDARDVLTESNYQYNAKINQATFNDPVGHGPAPTGKVWALLYWVQCNAEGMPIDENGTAVPEEEAVKFVRGQRMGAEHLYFYPHFELVDSVVTVTFYKDDESTLLGTAKIPYGKNINNYADEFAAKVLKESDSEYHYIVKNWADFDDEIVNFVTEEVTVKPVYTAEAHNKQLFEVVAEPTCNVPGFAHYKCDVAECTDITYNVPIDPVADEGAPTGQFYVGSNKWTLDNYVAGIDYSDVKYVGPNTQVIVNTKDTGSVSAPWNEDGKLARGVGKIEYAVSANGATDPTTITKWTEIYNAEELKQEALASVLSEYKITLVEYNGYNRGTAEEKVKKAEIDRKADAILGGFNANATGVLSNLNLENGKEYIIYIRITDREGNGEVNKSYLSSGTIHYGTVAPEIKVAGDGYGTKFCADATITVSDDMDGVKVYLNGTEVALTDGKFTCDTAGVHTVTAVDKNGNKATKTFEIKGSHSYRNYTTAATCDTAGSRYDLCTVCGVKANEKVIAAFGHSYTVNYIDKAADCINDGKRIYVCDNNCGKKLELKPTDDAETLAQAQKVKDPDAEEIEWVAITAKDLEHLKATGKHTYEMVKDANGEDTAEYVWVIDKAATCKVAGSQHRDCTVCGIVGRVSEEIPLDTENGHKFYREKVTTAPTCTTEGIKTKTCRYCGIVVEVGKVDALGHTAGEYRVITEATCDTKGSKILTCEVCNIDIGEPVKDADGKVTGYDGKSVEIDAIGHAWKIDGEVYEEDGKYYQNYVCKNDSTHTDKKEVVDYQPPVAATVTFDFNGGSYTVPAVGTPDQIGYVPEMLKGTQTISAYVGETIAASEVETAFKQSNATKTYTFEYWATKNADGTYAEVKFPIEVKGDATYYAVYSEKYVNYTITYYKEDGITEYKKTGYIHNGEEVTLADGPSKAATNLVTYKFAGWAVIGSNPEVVYTDKVTINAANINLKAKYTEVAKKYAVTYAYSKSDILETFEVEAGTAARDCAIEPVKAKDSKYHYEFKAWNKAEQLANVESNIYTTPDFEAVLHTYSKTLKTAATCTEKAVYTYTCTNEACKHSYDAAEGEALGHSWGEPVYDETTGTNTVTCQRCNASQEDTRTFTVKFYINATDTQPIKSVPYIAFGTTIDKVKLPADPTKEATSTTEYIFKGWALKGDTTNTVVDFDKVVIKSDAEYVAVFTEVTRKYTVIFAYDATRVIEKHTDVPAGETVVFGGTTPTKAPDVNYHYTFKGWSGSTANVQGNVYVTAEFDKAEHSFTETELTVASCTSGKGTRYWCDCNGNDKFDDKTATDYVDYFYDVTGKPLAHDYEIVDRKDATETEDGYIKYKCKNCPATKEDKIPFIDNFMIIEINVKNAEGQPVEGARVDLYKDSEVDPCATQVTNSDGQVTFRVEKGHSYSYVVSYDGNSDGEKRPAGEGKTDATISIHRCSCACHGDGIWSAIFRFFHKLIKMFTGEFKCCKDPDSRY